MRRASPFSETYVAHLANELKDGEYQVLRGVPKLLDDLDARGVLLGLQTGNLKAGAEIKLAHGKLWHRFSFGGFGLRRTHARRARRARD